MPTEGSNISLSGSRKKCPQQVTFETEKTSSNERGMGKEEWEAEILAAWVRPMAPVLLSRGT